MGTEIHKILFFVFIVLLLSADVSFGQDLNTPSKNGTANSMPSISDLITVVDKATSSDSEAEAWSTPVKLVIIFAGLAILPSLLVMMTSFTRIVIVLAFVRLRPDYSDDPSYYCDYRFGFISYAVHDDTHVFQDQ